MKCAAGGLKNSWRGLLERFELSKENTTIAIAGCCALCNICATRLPRWRSEMHRLPAELKQPERRLVSRAMASTVQVMEALRAR